jgi:hypothetical protein
MPCPVSRQNRNRFGRRDLEFRQATLAELSRFIRLMNLMNNRLVLRVVFRGCKAQAFARPDNLKFGSDLAYNLAAFFHFEGE